MGSFVPNSSIDVLLEYLPLLQKPKLAQLSETSKKNKVAIVGAGAAGICAAYELLRMGLIPTIFEVNDRIGGRIYTQKFNYCSSKNQPYAELGAMRIPPSSHIFFHYAKLLKLTLINAFPNPGVVDTLIQYCNSNYSWKANHKLPPPFDEINVLWDLFFSPIKDRITNAWRIGDIETVIKIWQYCIDQYSNKSFFEVLNEYSPLAKNENLIHLFGAIGFGHGGFHSLYSISFIDLLRVIVNGYNENHVFIEQGMIEFINRLYIQPVRTEHGLKSLKQLNCLHLNTAILSLDYNHHSNKPIVRGKNNKTNELFEHEYDAVIYTGTSSAAYLLNLSNVSVNGIFLLNSEERKAIRNSYMISASKTYILTKDKFWKNQNMPSCIITDELPKAAYFIDLPNVEEGIICLSYTWGMDSIRLNAVDPEELVPMFLQCFNKINPNLSKYLIPVNQEIINVNWANNKYQNGAFKLLPPGYEKFQSHLYCQFKSVLNPDDKGIYLAGDCVSWQGGWVEGALSTAINAVFAVAKRFGGDLIHPNPLEDNPPVFHY